MANLIKRMRAFAESKGLRPGEVFERVVRVAYQDIILPGDTVIDVGAHTGFHLFPMSEAVGAAGTVYAFEPVPNLVTKLLTRIEQQSISNIRLYKYALSKEKGSAIFRYFKNYPGYSGLKRRQTPFDDDQGGLDIIVVEKARLDDIIPRRGKNSVYKNGY